MRVEREGILIEAFGERRARRADDLVAADEPEARDFGDFAAGVFIPALHERERGDFALAHAEDVGNLKGIVVAPGGRQVAGVFGHRVGGFGGEVFGRAGEAAQAVVGMHHRMDAAPEDRQARQALVNNAGEAARHVDRNGEQRNAHHVRIIGAQFLDEEINFAAGDHARIGQVEHFAGMLDGKEFHILAAAVEALVLLEIRCGHSDRAEFLHVVEADIVAMGHEVAGDESRPGGARIIGRHHCDAGFHSESSPFQPRAGRALKGGVRNPDWGVLPVWR